jgi:hypothetical protein
VAQGKEAAHRMHEYLKKRISSRHRPEVHRA